jgi:hypothetical protein
MRRTISDNRPYRDPQVPTPGIEGVPFLKLTLRRYCSNSVLPVAQVLFQPFPFLHFFLVVLDKFIGLLDVNLQAGTNFG